MLDVRCFAAGSKVVQGFNAGHTMRTASPNSTHNYQQWRKFSLPQQKQPSFTVGSINQFRSIDTKSCDQLKGTASLFLAFQIPNTGLRHRSCGFNVSHQ